MSGEMQCEVLWERRRLGARCLGGCGFTLVEMLVVIAIIMLLMGLLMPAFTGAKQMARKTKAKNEVKQLDIAWKSVMSDYRSWRVAKVAVGKSAMDSTRVDYLGGQNDKGIAYVDFDGRSTNSAGMVDPWDNVYQVALGNDQVTPYDSPINRTVAVWSKGPDGKDDAAQTRRDDVKSWE